jgi:hypothetical protein
MNDYFIIFNIKNFVKLTYFDVFNLLSYFLI